GIRYFHVTGVQTCALPILSLAKSVCHQYPRLLSTTVTRMAVSNVTPFYEGEPEAPVVRTNVPGPKSSKEIEELNEVFDTRAVSLDRKSTRLNSSHVKISYA